MGGFGSAQGMRDSLKGNKMLLRKKSLFKKERTFLNIKKEYFKAAGGIVDLKMATKEELAVIRNKIIKQRRKENRIYLLILLIIIPPIIYASFSFIQRNLKSNSQLSNIELKDMSDKYSFFITDGDNYLKKGNWNIAIHQYNKALAIFPNDYNAKYRLAYAFVYRCRNEKIECDIASEIVTELLNQFSEKPELGELEQILVFIDE